MDLLERFQTHLTHLGLPPGRALVAVSGGPDSVVLLDLLCRTSASHHLELIVAHVDHGIHPASGVVAGRVEQLARGLGLPVEIGRLNLGPDAGETRAREERYAWLESARRRHGAAIILTAHHADDQAETVLMRVLAGSGPAGLAGIAEVSGHLVRPFLRFRREALTRYVRERGLAVWIDPANQDPRHLRSWLRCDVLPILRARLPEVDAALLRVGRQAAGDRAAWSAVLDLLPGLDLRHEDGGISVAAPPIAGYDSALGQGVLLALARRAGCPMGPARAGRVLGLVVGAASGTSVPLASGWRAELAFDRLRLVPGPLATPPDHCSVEGESGEAAWGPWQIRWRREPAPGVQSRTALTAWFTPGPLTLRHCAPGDRVRPLAGTGRRLLVRCFQDARVPRGRRADWPVLAGADMVVWVPGVCRSDALLPAAGTEALRIDAAHA